MSLLLGLIFGQMYTMQKEAIQIFWFRRDLRLEDNHALYQALISGCKVLPIFIFDENILSALACKQDRRVSFIHDALSHINTLLRPYGSAVQFFYGTPLQVFHQLVETYPIRAVFCNEDYEPYAIKRDEEVKNFLASNTIGFYQYKDQVIFHKSDIVKSDGLPYTIYTPYSKRWLAQLPQKLPYYSSEKQLAHLLSMRTQALSLEQMGFEKVVVPSVIPLIDVDRIKAYDQYRDIPVQDATSQLGVHLRFGTMSIRRLVESIRSLNLVFLKELIWREFFMQILFHFPYVVHNSFKRKYDRIVWDNDEKLWHSWCEGKTGYPLVDAGMRQLNATGFMHNRVRMLTASFLVKHLRIDWRWGEAYFAEKLLDYDLAANNGNWQWAAGTGCDAVPYFRIFNPSSQQEKFDKEGAYVKKWVPEFGTNQYPLPIVNHTEAREKSIKMYKAIEV